MNFKEALINAEDVIGNHGKHTGNFGFIYPVTNENTNEIFLEEEIKGKNCLSVQASSDQVFDLYLKGANSITTFDLNPLTEYYFHLKKGAMMAGFTFEEYISFFTYCPFDENQTTKPFDEKMFQRILPYLDPSTSYFWSYLISKYTGFGLRKSKLFSFEIENPEYLSQAVHYLDKENYRKLQAIIHDLDIKFMNLNISELPNHLNENYDFMYFSNIIQHISPIFENRNLIESTLTEKDLLEKYRQLMVEISKHLNSNGTMIVGNVPVTSFRRIWNAEVFTLEKGYSYRKYKTKKPQPMEQTGAAIIYKKR